MRYVKENCDNQAEEAIKICNKQEFINEKTFYTIFVSCF